MSVDSTDPFFLKHYSVEHQQFCITKVHRSDETLIHAKGGGYCSTFAFYFTFYYPRKFSEVQSMEGTYSRRLINLRVLLASEVLGGSINGRHIFGI